MSNRETSIGAEYWRLSVLDWTEILSLGTGAEGGDDEPPKFKVIRHRKRVPLSESVPQHLGQNYFTDSADNFERQANEDQLSEITTLLHYAFGFSRMVMGPTNIWPYHRYVASARCFFPTELYICIGDDGDIDAGIYHYDPLHHSLVLLREGDWRHTLGRASGTVINNTKYTVILTSMFWKNAFRYRHYSYRLCTQEAGLVAGNILQVASSLGLKTQIQYQFLDRAVNKLLGLPSSAESAMSILPITDDDIGETAGMADEVQIDAEDLASEIPEIDQEWFGPWNPADYDLWSSTLDIDAHSQQDQSEDYTKYVAPPLSIIRGKAVRLPQPVQPSCSLSDALKNRHSGEIMFNPTPEDMTSATFSAVLQGAQRPYRSDTGPTPYTGVYALVNAVEGLTPGLYQVQGETMAYRKILDVPHRDLISELSVIPPSINLHSANAVIYIFANHKRALTKLGNRSYRILTQDAAIVAQRIATKCAALGFAARIHNGLPARELKQTLWHTNDDEVPLFQVAIGRRKFNGQYEPEIVF